MDDEQLRDEIDPLMTPWSPDSKRPTRPGRLEDLPVRLFCIEESASIFDMDFKMCPRCHKRMTLSVLDILVHQDYDQMLACTSKP
jgi:hypothetical protein